MRNHNHDPATSERRLYPIWKHSRSLLPRAAHKKFIRIGDTLILGPIISTALICFSYGNNMVNLHRVRGALSTMERNHLAGIGFVQNARGNMSIAGISDILQISAQNIISGSGVAAKSLAMKPCAKQFRADPQNDNRLSVLLQIVTVARIAHFPLHSRLPKAHLARQKRQLSTFQQYMSHVLQCAITHTIPSLIVKNNPS